MASAVPGWADICATVAASDIALPVDRFPPGELLADGYLNSLRTLLLSVRSPLHHLSGDLLATVTVDTRDAASIRAVARNAGGCAANAMGSVHRRPARGRTVAQIPRAENASVVNRAGDTVALKVSVLEGFAKCVVTGRVPDRFVSGTVDADMPFCATPDAWKLERMTDCPRPNDPALPSFDRAAPDETGFRFIADICHRWATRNCDHFGGRSFLRRRPDRACLP